MTGKNLVKSENWGHRLSYAMMMNPAARIDRTESSHSFKHALKLKVTDLISMI